MTAADEYQRVISVFWGQDPPETPGLLAQALAADPGVRAAVEREACELAYRDASREVHREARWTHEQTMRGTSPDPLERLLVVEKILLDRADELTYRQEPADG